MVKGDIDLTEHRDFKLDKDDIEKKYLPDISRKPWYDKYNPTSMELKTEFNSLETQIARSLYRIYNDIDDSWQTFSNIGSYNFEGRVNRIFEVFDEYIDNDYSDHYNDIYNILDVHFNRETASLTYTYNSTAYNSNRRVYLNINDHIFEDIHQESLKIQKARELIEKLFGPKKKPLKQLSLATDGHNYSKCYFDHGFIIGDCPKCNKKIYDAPTEIRDIKFKNISVEEKYMSEYDVELCINEIYYKSEILESLSRNYNRHIYRNNPNIPWLNKLSKDNYNDYMDMLIDKEEKDYSHYLTSTWFVENRV